MPHDAPTPRAQSSGECRAAVAMLRHAVVLPWESVDQVVKDFGDIDLGDARSPGTGAWHLRHIVEIFQVHAAAVRGEQPPDPAPLPDEPRALRDALVREIDALDAWLARQDGAFFTRPVIYGGRHTFLEMMSIMLQHITWHAAAAHYWMKFSKRWNVEPR